MNLEKALLKLKEHTSLIRNLINNEDYIQDGFNSIRKLIKDKQNNGTVYDKDKRYYKGDIASSNLKNKQNEIIPVGSSVNNIYIMILNEAKGLVPFLKSDNWKLISKRAKYNGPYLKLSKTEDDIVVEQSKYFNVDSQYILETDLDNTVKNESNLGNSKILYKPNTPAQIVDFYTPEYQTIKKRYYKRVSTTDFELVEETLNVEVIKYDRTYLEETEGDNIPFVELKEEYIDTATSKNVKMFLKYMEA